MSQSHPTPVEKSPDPPEAATSGPGPSPHQSLHSLLHSIALPKTKKAKSCSVPLETLLKACKLISVACNSVQHPPHNPSLSTIIQKLDESSVLINPTLATIPQTYALVLWSKATPLTPQPPPRSMHHCDTKFDITLAQKDCSAPVLTDLTGGQLANKVWEALDAADWKYDTRPSPSLAATSDDGSNFDMRIRAAGFHHSGDIWFSTYSEDEYWSLLLGAPSWLPYLSHQQVVPNTYPIIIHGIPVSFDPSHDNDDITLLDENHHQLGHLSILQHAEFISYTPNCNPSKAHTSLVLYLTNPHATNDYITQHVALCGCLHPTAQFYHHPPQYCNCFHFGHFTCSCKTSAVCACCVGAHATGACKCPWANPCEEAASCCHTT